jgi:hypothetical protein
MHAVSGRFDLEDIPTSPPTTPAAPGEGVDYFTTRVFDGAVSVPDYQHQSFASAQRNVQLGGQSFALPRPAVAPSSIDLSITERYIPPASASEFINLTDPLGGNSLLSDRFVELSEDGGVLIFIYPTATGGKTFVRSYLGIMNRFLRGKMVTGLVTAEDCEFITNMKSVDALLSFDDLKSRLEVFCEKLSNLDASSTLFHRFPSISGKGVSFELIHASKRAINLAPEVWVDWWIRQEKARIKQALESSRAHVQSSNLTSNSERSLPTTGIPVPSTPSAGSAAALTSEPQVLLNTDEIFHKLAQLAAEQRPSERIELGVFVVKKERAKGS